MTGPAEGKIPLEGYVEAKLPGGWHRIDCDIYLHVKGYSLARVTHVDLEHPELNDIVPPGSSHYVPFRLRGERIDVALRGRLRGRDVYWISIWCPDLARALGEGHSYVYIGGKYGGVFLGFKREYVRKLEEFAVRMGVKPRSRG
ncbi:hypothetical protein B6U99_00920 [Candidatus Geothermarchaeota archaeon ex4572_27]|nr:MAG: hypothetical protein B6U99_00920 [Candidatus Geothermarchaeota archaeon ex4572_27]